MRERERGGSEVGWGKEARGTCGRKGRSLSPERRHALGAGMQLAKARELPVDEPVLLDGGDGVGEGAGAHGGVVEVLPTAIIGVGRGPGELSSEWARGKTEASSTRGGGAMVLPHNPIP